jgi:hypothetical protein
MLVWGWISVARKMVDFLVGAVEGINLSYSGSPISKSTVAIVLSILVILFVGYGLPCQLICRSNDYDGNVFINLREKVS